MPRTTRVVLARPVAADQVDLPGVGLVQGGVVEDQDAAVDVNQGSRLLPEVLGVGLQAGQQPGEGVVGGVRLRRKADDN